MLCPGSGGPSAGLLNTVCPGSGGPSPFGESAPPWFGLVQTVPSHGTSEPSPLGLGTNAIVEVALCPPGSVTTVVVAGFLAGCPGAVEFCVTFVVDGTVDDGEPLGVLEHPATPIAAVESTTTTRQRLDLITEQIVGQLPRSWISYADSSVQQYIPVDIFRNPTNISKAYLPQRPAAAIMEYLAKNLIRLSPRTGELSPCSGARVLVTNRSERRLRRIPLPVPVRHSQH